MEPPALSVTIKRYVVANVFLFYYANSECDKMI